MVGPGMWPMIILARDMAVIGLAMVRDKAVGAVAREGAGGVMTRDIVVTGVVMARDVAGVGMTRNMEVAGGFVARGMAVAGVDMSRDW